MHILCTNIETLCLLIMCDEINNYQPITLLSYQNDDIIALILLYVMAIKPAASLDPLAFYNDSVSFACAANQQTQMRCFLLRTNRRTLIGIGHSFQSSICTTPAVINHRVNASSTQICILDRHRPTCGYSPGRSKMMN